MKILMFGWEYPPHVYGGLATANYGITEGLHMVMRKLRFVSPNHLEMKTEHRQTFLQ